MKTVMHLKLIGGEEILGTVDEEYGELEGFVILTNVRSLMAQSLGQGQVGLGMVPYMMGNPNATIKIPQDMVIGEPISDIVKELEDQYLQQVSGLTFATAGNSGKIQM